MLCTGRREDLGVLRTTGLLASFSPLYLWVLTLFNFTWKVRWGVPSLPYLIVLIFPQVPPLPPTPPQEHEFLQFFHPDRKSGVWLPMILCFSVHLKARENLWGFWWWQGCRDQLHFIAAVTEGQICEEIKILSHDHSRTLPKIGAFFLAFPLRHTGGAVKGG